MWFLSKWGWSKSAVPSPALHPAALPPKVILPTPSYQDWYPHWCMKSLFGEMILTVENYRKKLLKYPVSSDFMPWLYKQQQEKEGRECTARVRRDGRAALFWAGLCWIILHSCSFYFYTAFGGQRDFNIHQSPTPQHIRVFSCLQMQKNAHLEGRVWLRLQNQASDKHWEGCRVLYWFVPPVLEEMFNGRYRRAIALVLPVYPWSCSFPHLHLSNTHGILH